MNAAKIALMVAVLLVGVMLAGCKKKEQPAAPAGSQTIKETSKSTEQAARSITQTAGTETEQTICPVMGNPIDKNVFVEYKGKKVYFCCAECKEKFAADPEKYIAKLPQFKQ